MSTTLPTPADPFPPTPKSSHEDLIAGLGPMRTAWETWSPIDPILTEKMREHVAVRRERFTKYVKATVGACLALCVLAVIVSAVSGGEGSGTSASSETSVRKSSPAIVQASVEKLDIVQRGKAGLKRRRF